MKSVLSLALLVFLLFGVFLSTGSASAQTTDTAVIIVQVRDQYGAWYDGVQVQISAQSGSSLFTGITQNGFVASGNLTTGQYYTVIVSSPTSSKNQTVYLSTQNIFVNFNLTRPAAPVLSINKVNFLPNLIAPGSTFTAQITISSSTAVAYNAMISFNTTYPLGVTGTGSTFPLGLIGASSTYTLNANFSVAPIASTGDYNVPYSLTFSDVSGVTYTSTGQITVPVTGTPTRPQLIVAQVHFNPQVISSGTTFTTYINVNNTGSQEAYGASISVQPATQVSLIGSSGVISLGNLAPYQNETIALQMYSGTSAQSGIIPVAFTFLYNNKFGVLFNTSGQFGVALSSAPNLQIGQFTLSNVPLRPGISTLMNLTVDNVGGAGAYGVAVTVSGKTFLTSNSSNYLGAVPSDTNLKTGVFLTVANKTQGGSYIFTVNLSYQDINGNKFSSNANYSVLVEPYTPPEVTITNVLLDPPVITQGTSGSISIFLQNSGPTVAKNVVVNIKGGNGIVSSNYFGLGTISPDGQVTQVIGVNVDPKLAPGSYTLYLNATYADPTGKVYSSVVPMQVTVYAASNLFSLTNIAAIGGIVVLAFAAILVLRKFKMI